jgi:hypothetical protein
MHLDRDMEKLEFIEKTLSQARALTAIGMRLRTGIPAAFVGRVVTIAVLSVALCDRGVAYDFGTLSGIPAGQGAAVATVATLPGAVLASAAAAGLDARGFKTSDKAAPAHRIAAEAPFRCRESVIRGGTTERRFALLPVASGRAPPSPVFG